MSRSGRAHRGESARADRGGDACAHALRAQSRRNGHRLAPLWPAHRGTPARRATFRPLDLRPHTLCDEHDTPSVAPGPDGRRQPSRTTANDDDFVGASCRVNSASVVMEWGFGKTTRAKNAREHVLHGRLVEPRSRVPPLHFITQHGEGSSRDVGSRQSNSPAQSGSPNLSARWRETRV